ncbi:hypothetical protein [Methylophilus sp. YYY-1]|nr:hypothetical protein [Methylophilus sp. YYY-1]
MTEKEKLIEKSLRPLIKPYVAQLKAAKTLAEQTGIPYVVTKK